MVVVVVGLDFSISGGGGDGGGGSNGGGGGRRLKKELGWNRNV